ncbi:MAG: YtxH domain-containing protein [Chloroflexota bacterium]|nr:YtxH domain-containing protein [Chloroflexota bacterium]
MSRRMWMWVIAGLIIGVIVGAVIGYFLAEGTKNPVLLVIGWIVISAIGSTLFFGFWGYADEQQKRVRQPDLIDE